MLTSSDLFQLAPPLDGMRVEQRLAPRGSALVRAGEPGIRVRVILSGWAYRYCTLQDGRRQILSVLLPGDAFGLETLMEEPTGASVQTATAVRYLAVAPSDLADAVDQSTEFRRHVLKALLAEKAALEEWVVRLGQCDAEERTAGLLVSLHERLARVGLVSDSRFTLQLTQHEMADLVGLHVIHLNRVLGRLRTRGLLAIADRVVTLIDTEALADLVPPLRPQTMPMWLLPAHAPPPGEPIRSQLPG